MLYWDKNIQLANVDFLFRFVEFFFLFPCFRICTGLKRPIFIKEKKWGFLFSLNWPYFFQGKNSLCSMPRALIPIILMGEEKRQKSKSVVILRVREAENRNGEERSFYLIPKNWFIVFWWKYYRYLNKKFFTIHPHFTLTLLIFKKKKC